MVDIFRKHWSLKASSTNNNCEISKGLISRKIVAMATKEIRPPLSRPVWYVEDKVLHQLELDNENFNPLTPIGSPTTITSAKRGTKRCHGDATPNTKSLKDFFKSPNRSTESVARYLNLTDDMPSKKLKLATPTKGEATPPNNDVILIEDDTKENIPLVNDRHGNEEQSINNNGVNMQSINHHDNEKGIDWEQCLSNSHHLSVPIDCHL